MKEREKERKRERKRVDMPVQCYVETSRHIVRSFVDENIV